MNSGNPVTVVYFSGELVPFQGQQFFHFLFSCPFERGQAPELKKRKNKGNDFIKIVFASLLSKFIPNSAKD